MAVSYAYRKLSQYGFDCYHLAGGFRLYNVVKKDLDL